MPTSTHLCIVVEWRRLVVVELELRLASPRAEPYDESEKSEEALGGVVRLGALSELELAVMKDDADGRPMPKERGRQ
ncbi:hypothetical protein E2562_004368 [Oryza meyeriana var. granulata]|uniref:DUF834 domain-containing protein n=1 Tax=Oryza meyeriana var. granulata TaxID=110450 RepID=A0A6G1CZ34_9ORYZ|nr:hypothetical protein E2562_004368 [Oryza meyeriana var. granulata]